jgi:catechol 2,3-dioxygenase-like lactoylglutathione lyase family enzyme
MLTINKVDHINLSIHPYRETIDFYKQVFGMKTFEEGDSHGSPYEIIGIPGKLFLCLYESSPGTQEGAQNGGVNHLGIHIENFDQAKKDLIDQGIELHYGGEVHYPKSRSLYIEDPSGNAIELSESFAGGLGA